MGLKTQVDNLTTIVSELRGTVNALVKDIKSIKDNNGNKISLKPIITITVAGFSIISVWLGVLTTHLLK